MSERCVYQSLLTCGITLPHQSCKNFDSTRVLPPVRVIFSGNLRGYGGSAARYFWKAIIECISSLRCLVRYANYGGGRLSTSVLLSLDFSVRIGVQVAHGQTVLLTTITVLSTSPGGRVQDCMHPVVALYRRPLAKSRDMVQGIIRM